MMLINELASADLLQEFLHKKYLTLTESESHGLIYHYCSGLTFPEIVKNKELRLTPITRLNDYAEGLWICHIITRRVMGQMCRLQSELEADDEKARTKIYSDFYEYLLPQISGYIERYTTFQFICCFSEEPDSLNQFRLYADDCKGYSLGFNISQLNAKKITLGFPVISFKEGFYLFPVIYDIKLQKLIVKQQIDKAVEKYRQNHNRCCLLNTLQYLATLACVFKHPSFHEEKEWRLIYICSKDESNTIEHQFQHKDNYLSTCYPLEFEEGKISLEKVRIGSRNFSYDKHVELYLNEQGFPFRASFEIEKSNSTYRGKL